MRQIVINPLQWNELPNLDAMDHELNTTDSACLAEVRAVLERHGKLLRFGLTLLHRHFGMEEDEVLLETVDVSQRTLNVRPVRKAELGRAIPTQWALAATDVGQWCSSYCDYQNDEHKTWHTHKE